MSEPFLVPVNEDKKQFQEEFIKIKEDIKIIFLAMTHKKRQGFFISLPTALNWLRLTYKDTKHFRRHFKEKYLLNENYYFKEATSEEDYNAHYIYRNNFSGDIRIKIPWFSDKGFKKLCMVIEKTPCAELVREYYIELEEDYINTLKLNNEQLKEKHDNLIKQFKKVDSECILLQSSNEILEIEVEKNNSTINWQSSKILKYYEQNVILSKQLERLKVLENLFKNNSEPDFNNGNILLELYQKSYGKPYYLYVISDKWVLQNLQSEYNSRCKKSKKINEDEILKDTLEPITNLDIFREKYDLLKYDIEDFDFESSITLLFQEDNEIEREFYFYVSKYKTMDNKYSKLLQVLYFYNDLHYQSFLERMKEQIINNIDIKNKIIKDTYKTFYNDIIGAYKDTSTKIAINLLK
jgi:hypothetical protein